MYFFIFASCELLICIFTLFVNVTFSGAIFSTIASDLRHMVLNKNSLQGHVTLFKAGM